MCWWFSCSNTITMHPVVKSLHIRETLTIHINLSKQFILYPLLSSCSKTHCSISVNSKLQKKLPASGMPVVERPSGQIDKMYEDYVKSETKRNWKFWIVSFIQLYTKQDNLISTNKVSKKKN